MDLEPTGLISFVIVHAPTSQQSKRATKDAFTRACKQAMEAFPITFHGEVKIHIE